MADGGSATPAMGARVDCVPLRARISERVCASVSTRSDARPLGCLGCALGAEVRSRLGVEGLSSEQVRARVSPWGERSARRVALLVVEAPPTAHQLGVRRGMARDRSWCSEGEVAEAQRLAAQRLAAQLYAAEGKVAVLARMQIARSTAHKLDRGRCTRGVLDVLRAAARGGER